MAINLATEVPEILLRGLLVILGAWGGMATSYIGILYWKNRRDRLFRVHFLHVTIAAAGYLLVCLALLGRAIFVPASYTWPLALSTPGFTLLNIAMSLLLSSGRLLNPIRKEEDLP